MSFCNERGFWRIPERLEKIRFIRTVGINSYESPDVGTVNSIPLGKNQMLLIIESSLQPQLCLIQHDANIFQITKVAVKKPQNRNRDSYSTLTLSLHL